MKLQVSALSSGDLEDWDGVKGGKAEPVLGRVSILQQWLSTERTGLPPGCIRQRLESWQGSFVSVS